MKSKFLSFPNKALYELFTSCPHFQPLSPCLLYASHTVCLCLSNVTNTFLLQDLCVCSYFCLEYSSFTSIHSSFSFLGKLCWNATCERDLPSPLHLKNPTNTNTPHPHSCTIPVCPFILFFFIALNNKADNISLPSRISAPWWSQLYCFIHCNAHST